MRYLFLNHSTLIVGIEFYLNLFIRHFLIFMILTPCKRNFCISSYELPRLSVLCKVYGIISPLGIVTFNEKRLLKGIFLRGSSNLQRFFKRSSPPIFLNVYIILNNCNHFSKNQNILSKIHFLVIYLTSNYRWKTNRFTVSQTLSISLVKDRHSESKYSLKWL